MCKLAHVIRYSAALTAYSHIKRFRKLNPRGEFWGEFRYHIVTLAKATPC